MASDILIAAPDIERRIRELGAEISRDYRDTGGVHLVCVLKGAFLFMADLVRAIDLPVTMDFMALSSYAKGTTTSGEVKLQKDLDDAIEGRHVLIVEDIVDTGLTLHYLREILSARGPRSVRTVCLLSKPSRRRIDVAVEYIGFTIEDQFVVGFGLDYAEHHRNLPHIAVLDSLPSDTR
jgi:hypoxanthine phosphoribosyltransferase